MGDSQYTQNIQINKVIGENEKYVLFYKKKPIMFLVNLIKSHTSWELQIEVRAREKGH